MAKALDRPPQTLPGRYSAVRASLAQLHATPLGMSAKTLANHRSNAKAALLWLAKERGIPRYGAQLTPEWERLRRAIEVDLVRWRLSALMRFCSANAIAPQDVNEQIVDRFSAYCEAATKPLTSASRRLLARAWNSAADLVPDWPKARLSAPLPRSTIVVP